MVKDLYDGLDNRVVQAVEKLDAVHMDSVRDLIDDLGQRVIDLEEGLDNMKTFHTVKPDAVDEAYAHISTPMGVHTKPRDPPPIQLTPEQTAGDEAMAIEEEYSPEVLTGEKTFSKMNVKPAVASKHVVSPDEGAEQKPSTNRKYTADELQQRVATKKINFALKK